MQDSFDSRKGVIWQDGEFKEWQEAKLHVLTHGLHYGSSAFEGIRIYDGKPFKLNEHLLRLKHSADVLGMKIPFEIEQLEQATHELIQKNNLSQGYIRPIIWRGSETMLISGKGCKTHVAIAMWEVFEQAREGKRKTGMKITISSWRKPAADASPYSTKSSCIYTLATIVKNDAEIKGFDDAMMLDSNGFVTEATTANFFVIKDKTLYTPPAYCFLDGITRQTIVSMAKSLGIEVREEMIHVEKLDAFEAAFLTGTAIEIMPIASIDNIEFDINNVLMHDLMENYSKLVRSQ